MWFISGECRPASRDTTLPTAGKVAQNADSILTVGYCRESDFTKRASVQGLRLLLNPGVKPVAKPMDKKGWI
jgi:hypothetical protein